VEGDLPPDGGEQRLHWLEAQAEQFYSKMYDAPFGGVTTLYSDAKEYLYDAIGLARRLGREQDAERLTERLAHIKAVFRSQFSA
jgi:hypothetical protein